MTAFKSEMGANTLSVIYGRVRYNVHLIARCQVRNHWPDFIWARWTVDFDARVMEDWNR